MKQKAKMWKGAVLAIILFVTLMGVVPYVFADDPPPDMGSNVRDMTFNTHDYLPNSAGDTNLSDFAGRVISIMLKLLASVGIAVMVFGGFKMITSQGNDTGLKKGQSAFMQAFVGIMIVLFAYIIISFVEGVITRRP